MTQVPDRLVASYHEAGHVIACLRLGIPFSHVTITPAWLADSCTGYVAFGRDGRPDTGPREDAIMSLAGGEAERHFRSRREMSEPDTSRWEVDLECARLACDRGGLRINDMRAAAFKLMGENWGSITPVAIRLNEKRRMAAGAVKRVSTSGRTTPA